MLKYSIWIPTRKYANCSERILSLRMSSLKLTDAKGINFISNSEKYKTKGQFHLNQHSEKIYHHCVSQKKGLLGKWTTTCRVGKKCITVPNKVAFLIPSCRQLRKWASRRRHWTTTKGKLGWQRRWISTSSQIKMQGWE